MVSWYNQVWKLSSIFYESIPANKAGAFFRHLQVMFELDLPSDLLRDMGVFYCIHSIGYYCRILCQLESYKKAEFNESIRSIICTDYGYQKIYNATRKISSITKEVGYTLDPEIEDYDLYDTEKDHAFLVSHVIYYALEDILENHKFVNPIQQAAVDFYHSLVRFVIYSGMPDHKLIPAYVTTKLAKLINLLLSRPIVLTLPNIDDFTGREYLNENAPIFYEEKFNYTKLSPNLELAVAPLEDLIYQLETKGVAVEVAQEKVAKDIALEAKDNPEMRTKLVKWGQSLGNVAVSEIVRGIVKLAIRSLGFPLP